MKTVMRGIVVAAFTALLGFQTTAFAAQGQRLWSIVIHFQYEDGFEFDYVLQHGLSAKDLGAALAECGRSHQTKSVGRYHCYPVAE